MSKKHKALSIMTKAEVKANIPVEPVEPVIEPIEKKKSIIKKLKTH